MPIQFEYTYKKNHPKVVDEKEDNEVEIEIELNETEFDDFNMPSSSINESFGNLDEYTHAIGVFN